MFPNKINISLSLSSNIGDEEMPPQIKFPTSENLLKDPLYHGLITICPPPHYMNEVVVLYPPASIRA